MATTSDIVTRAMRSLRLLSSGEEPTADEMSDGIVAFNDMLFAWRIEGLDIAHVTLDENDTIDVPEDHLGTLRLALAARIGGEYGGELTAYDQMVLDEGMKALRAYYLNLAELVPDNPLAWRNLALKN